MAGSFASGSTRRGRRSLAAEINVTPFVDVMLVLLIVFMITAPLLTTGVDVSLPKAGTEALPAPKEPPLSVSIDSTGKVYVQDTEVALEELPSMLFAITGEGYEGRIYVRGDENVNYGRIIEVIARLQAVGYQNTALVTDPKFREAAEAE